MITPRRITLHRVPDLFTFRALLTGWLTTLSPERASHTYVLVPTLAAAEQLRRTVEERALGPQHPALVWPIFGTRRDFYDALAPRLGDQCRMLSAFEREVIVASVARAVVGEGLELPYELRPGLIAEVLAFYDHVRRLGRTVSDFERNFTGELEPEQDTDRGARQLLTQTAFLAAVYRAYQRRLEAIGALDEHGLRDRLIREPLSRPLDRVIVTLGDRVVEKEGLWPADYDLLSRLPQLQQIDVIGTEAVLASGYLERLLGVFPDLAEERPSVPRLPRPVLVAPEGPLGTSEPVCSSSRDREEEMIAVARRLKQQRREGTAAPLQRTALVVQAPLPYLYVARDVFRDAGIPFEALDTLPLAAEPYAAAVDLVLDAVAADFTRDTLLALLRSPHFNLTAQLSPVADDEQCNAAIRALGVALAEARYLGGLHRLIALAEAWSHPGAVASREQRRRQIALPALQALVVATTALRPLGETRSMVDQIDVLVDWLHRFDRPSDDGTRVRRLRVKGAIVGALSALRAAYALHDAPAEGDVSTLTSGLRRWLEAQTFATHSGEPGLQLVDAEAARYGDFDDVQIVGLVDGEWPERARRNVLYPSSLLALLEPAPALRDPNANERDGLQAARAAFRDLLLLPAERLRLSTFLLENDAVVEPSLLVDEVEASGLSVVREAIAPARVTYAEALSVEPRRFDVLPPQGAAWAAMRLSPDTRSSEMLQGEAGAWQMPRVSVSRLEMFLSCPFRFFAAHVLKLEEEPDDRPIQTPLERGRFLHDLWERFFAEWQRRGHGRIDQEGLPDARALFAEVCEEALATLSPIEAALERHKLLGSAVSPGIAHRVLAMEAGRRDRVIERLLEFPLEGQFPFRGRDGTTRTIAINAKTDRIDVLEGRRLRVIDYKSKTTPDPKMALQLPVYAHLARELLQQARGTEYSLDEAMYLSFEGDRAVVALRPGKGETLDSLIGDAHERLIDALDRIASGRFPVRPAKKSMCGPCGYRTVCRLEYALEGGEGSEGGEGGSEGQVGQVGPTGGD